MQFCPQNQTEACFCTATDPLVPYAWDARSCKGLTLDCLSGLQNLTCSPLVVDDILKTICQDYPLPTDPSAIKSATPSSTSVHSPSTSIPSTAPNAGTAESGFPGDVIDPLDTTGPTQASKSSGLSNGVIVGITISAVAALAIVAGLIMYIVKVKHQQPKVAKLPQVPHLPLPQDSLPELPPQNYPIHPSTLQQPPTS